MSTQETTAAARAAPRPSALTWQELAERVGIALVLFVLIAAITIIEKIANGTTYFFSIENFSNIARQVPWQAPLALGEFLTILTAGIDLSVGSVMALAMAVMVLAAHGGVPAIPAMLIALLVGGIAGAVNGLALTRFKLPHPFIPTLAMLNIARGLTNLITNGTPILRVPWEIRVLGAGNVCIPACAPDALRIPVPFIIVVLLFTAFGIFLVRTRTGRHIYAVGGNPQAALYAGINVNRILTLVYILSGVLAGVAAILLAGRTNSAEPQAGVGTELIAIAAVIIGGGSFFGGRGNVLGVFVGLLIMGVIGNGLNILGVTVFLQQVAIGVIIFVISTLDVLRRRGSQV